MPFASLPGGDLYYEVTGDGTPILLIHPAGATASIWAPVRDELAGVGQVISYDRRGYDRSPGNPLHAIRAHTADAAALLDVLHLPAAVVAGTSVAATIGIDLALRRPDLVRAVVAHESPWRASRRLPTGATISALTGMGGLALRGRYPQAAERFMRFAYSYRDGGTAWDAFPEQWRRAARENPRATLADIRIAIGAYPPRRDLARITTPVVCTHGSRSPEYMARITQALAHAIPDAVVREIDGAGHSVAFDAPAEFAKVIIDALG